MNSTRMSADERRLQIMGAVIPAIIQHGPSVTSRQLADAAGVAEGTLFRAFGDKDSLLRAVVAREGEVAYDLDGIRADDGRDLEATVVIILEQIVDRVGRFMELVFAAGPAARNAESDDEEGFGRLVAAVASVLEPHRDELRIDPTPAASILSTVAVAASSDWGQASRPLPPEVAREALLHGIAARPA